MKGVPMKTILHHRRSEILLGISLLFLSVQVSADVIDLTTAGADGSANGALFFQFEPAGSTGTGRIDPFLRIQASGIEQGYNTTGTPEYDTKDAQALALADVPSTQVDGIMYREFLLDVNEPGGNKSLISLDQVKIYVASQSNLDDSQLGVPIYNLDAGTNNRVLLDVSLVSSGSGAGDMLMLIPSSLFGTNEESYVYLFARFGDNQSTEGGFEEWSVGHDQTISCTILEVPEPATLTLLAGGGLLFLRRRA